MYKPLPDGLEIATSITHGMGLFASDKFDAGHNFGTCHIDMEGDLIRTPLGGWINHSEEPNCEKQANAYIIEKEGKKIFFKRYNLVAIKDIKAGEELTLKYTFYKID